MTHNLKTLGLALVAALALSAIGAQGATAVVEHSFRSDAVSQKTVSTGQNEGNHVLSLGTGGPLISCTSVTFSGTNNFNVRDTLTVQPKYSSCTALGSAVSFTTNGCYYILDSDTTTNPHFGGEHAAVTVECEASHDIIVDSVCKVTLTAANSQSLHGMRYTQVAASSKHSITVTSTIGQIHYTTTGGLPCTAIGKPQGTYTDGIYEGKLTLTGFEDGSPSGGSTTTGTTWNHGDQVDITVSTPE